MAVTTRDYLKGLNKSQPPTPSEIEENILDEISSVIRQENAMREKGEKFVIPKTLCSSTIADILIELHHAVNIVDNLNNPTYGSVAIYCDYGPNNGIYITNDNLIAQVIMQYNYDIKTADIREIINKLSAKAPNVLKCRERSLVPVNNGIFDYDTKTLMPFSPDFVFTSKSCINLNPTAQPVVIRQPDGRYVKAVKFLFPILTDGDTATEWWYTGSTAESTKAPNNRGFNNIYYSETLFR